MASTPDYTAAGACGHSGFGGGGFIQATALPTRSFGYQPGRIPVRRPCASMNCCSVALRASGASMISIS